MDEIFFSTDIEADGRIPGPNSLLSFALVAMTADKKLLGTFNANLETLPDATQEKENKAWWNTQPHAWAACRSDQEHPRAALNRCLQWVQSFDGVPIFVAAPGGFDFMWMHWYFIRFLGTSPFGLRLLDMRSFLMGQRGCAFGAAGISSLPAWMSEGLPHTHVALDDAMKQCAIFGNMLEDNRAGRAGGQNGHRESA